MQNCPKCGSPRVHRSRSRNALERLRKLFTHKRMHRCHACGWRGWGIESDYAHDGEAPARANGAAPDLGAIDEAIGRDGEN